MKYLYIVFRTNNLAVREIQKFPDIGKKVKKEEEKNWYPLHIHFLTQLGTSV